jgi:hypothetical protein
VRVAHRRSGVFFQHAAQQGQRGFKLRELAFGHAHHVAHRRIVARILVSASSVGMPRFITQMRRAWP